MAKAIFQTSSLYCRESESESHSVLSDSLRLHGLDSPLNALGQNTGVGSLSLLQGIFPTQDQTQVSCVAGGFFTNWAIRSILKEISPEYSFEGLMLKLKLWYFGHLMRRTDSLEKALVLRQIESKRTRGWQRVRWLDGITNSMDMNLNKVGGIVEDRGAWHTTVYGVTKSWTRLRDEQQQQYSYLGDMSIWNLQNLF